MTFASGDLLSNRVITFYVSQWRSYTRAYPGICPCITLLCPGIRKCGSLWPSREYCVLRQTPPPPPLPIPRACTHTC